jgi:Zn-dependent protease
MAGAVRILSVRGIPVYVHVGWVFIYALITWSLAVGYFPQALPELPAAAHWINGLIAALLLFVSVLLHELSHSFVAMSQGLRVRGITLHVFGGVSHIEEEARTPRAEFLIAVAGPVTSFLIAAALGALVRWGGWQPGSTRAILVYLGFVNVAVGGFNLLPGYPLDGGRVLRAALWKWYGSLERATYFASQAGVGLAYGLMALGVLQILGGGVIGGSWMVLLGLFLSTAAEVSYAQTSVRRMLAKISVADVMTREVVTIGADATVAELVDLFWAHHVTSFPVVEGETVRGIVTVQSVHEVPRERWMHTRVRESMRSLTDDLVVAPRDSLVRALDKASRNGVGRLAVMDGGRLRGYLSLKDITHVLTLHAPPAQAAEARGALRRAA